MGLDFSFEQILNKLEELDKKVAKEITDDALKAGARVLLAEQEETVPVDSGKLQESLIVGKIKGTGRKRKIIVGIDPAQYDEVKYGFYQEHGTKVMLGKKWMKRAWIGSVKEASEKVAESLKEDLGSG